MKAVLFTKNKRASNDAKPNLLLLKGNEKNSSIEELDKCR